MAAIFTLMTTFINRLQTQTKQTTQATTAARIVAAAARPTATFARPGLFPASFDAGVGGSAVGFSGAADSGFGARSASADSDGGGTLGSSGSWLILGMVLLGAGTSLWNLDLNDVSTGRSPEILRTPWLLICTLIWSFLKPWRKGKGNCYASKIDIHTDRPGPVAKGCKCPNLARTCQVRKQCFQKRISNVNGQMGSP
ncbi:ATP synthase epsilon chain [Striga asiatica]|uniref:ATP synthase epsilon chain n=1 Tax=Striga asiatica TaxID=4170 RepID=A0A5A7QK83_STRAF|nr:ATP synthase epsilon chain [Striga asiatica]